MRTLYWDAFAGISGDMALGSLIALGADQKLINDQLNTILPSEFELEIRWRQVQGIQATDVLVLVKDEETHHRHLEDIEQMILKGSLTERAQANALSVFRVLAEAEARVHGTTIDHVHFHEVGAVDSIVDIVGTSIALDLLGVEEIIVSVLPWSHGFVHCAHGTLPVPAPATVEILQGFRFQEVDINGELITPTGAALLRALAKQAGFPDMNIMQVGYGAGKNDYGIPSLLRGVLGEN